MDQTWEAGLGLLLMSRAPSSEEGSERTQALVQRAAAGDLDAFEQLIKTQESRVFRVAQRLLDDRGDVEDAAQEVYLRLHGSLRRLHPASDPAPWIYRVTVNVCRDLNRRRRRGKWISLDDLLRRRPVEEPPSLQTGPMEQAVQAEEVRGIWRALAELPRKMRAALVLRDVEGLSTKEVAEILHTSEATVRSHISRGRLRLNRWRKRREGQGNA